MDVRHLELLRDLRERGSLAAVAAATHRTPSALSQQLRTAQRDAGVALTESHGRGIRLTEAGELLADGADDVAAALARVGARLEEHRGRPVGRVSIAGLPSALAFLLPPTVAALAESGVTLDVDDRDLAEQDYAAAVTDADIIVAHSLVSDTPAGSAGLHRAVLAHEPIDVALSADHPLATKDRLRARDVVEEVWIGVPEHYPFETILHRISATCGVPITPRLRVRDNGLVASLVEAREGIALLPRFTTREGEGLSLRPLVDVPSARWIVALSRPDRAERAAVRLVTRLLAHAAPDPGSLPARD